MAPNTPRTLLLTLSSSPRPPLSPPRFPCACLPSLLSQRLVFPPFLVQHVLLSLPLFIRLPPLERKDARSPSSLCPPRTPRSMIPLLSRKRNVLSCDDARSRSLVHWLADARVESKSSSPARTPSLLLGVQHAALCSARPVSSSCLCERVLEQLYESCAGSERQGCKSARAERSSRGKKLRGQARSRCCRCSSGIVVTASL